MKLNRKEALNIAGYLGAAFLIAGYVRYSVQELWTKWEIALVSVGAVLLVASLAFNLKSILGYFRTRSGRLGTNTAVLTIAVLGIFALVNYLGYRHHKRIDLTSEKLYSLSDQTRKIVSSLNKDVKIVNFSKEDDPQLRDQMEEFRDLSKRLSYERVDPQVKPEIARQYQITKMGEVVVASGSRVERPQGTSEQEITNAILKVTSETLKTVCFLEGHGEKGLTDSEGEGYSTVDANLKKENYQTKAVSLVTTDKVPTDCAVLVIAGPKKPLLQPEVAMIGKYLEGGGKAMMLLDPDTDPQLGDVLKAWNIDLGNNTVIDVSAAGQMFGGGPFAPLVLSYGQHPITKDFVRSMTIFPFARSVKPGTATGTGVTPTTLLTTSEASWGETQMKAGGTPEYDAATDLKGPIPLGVAAGKSAGEGEARLVVIGDSDFGANRAIGFQRNADLFLNSINWLAQDENLISIRPKSQLNRRVDLSASQQNLLFWLFVLVMPVAVLGTGVYIWWKRR
jgi:ABC-type uncharacterized transport system involved in gliding motility auxiliary subunit